MAEPAPGIRFHMAARSPAEWAEFIDQLYTTGTDNEAVQEIVQLTIMAACDAGYRAGVVAVAAYIRRHAEAWERPPHLRGRVEIDDEHVKKAISEVANMVEKMRPPPPDDDGERKCP